MRSKTVKAQNAQQNDKSAECAENDKSAECSENDYGKGPDSP